MTNRAVNISRKTGKASQAHEFETKNRVYAGKKIDVDMVDANIHDIFRLIAEISNFNIIASDDIKGKITLRLKNVPWDQVFDIILKSKELGISRVGNVIHVAPVARLSQEKQAAEYAKMVAFAMQQDEVLFQLYSFHNHILNPKDVPISLSRLSIAVGLSEKRVREICELLGEKYIKKIVLPHAEFYRIAPKGVKYVEQAYSATGTGHGAKG